MIIFQKPARPADQAALTRFARRARKFAGVSGDVSILIAGNLQLRALNRRFRKKDRPTDVLSFPSADGAGGDIAISAEIAKQNAALYGHKTLDELKVLVLHGMLHLAGYDHETDNGQMAERELALRAQLKLPASLIQRAFDRKVARKASRRKA
jgi:probable rRNA maturation factor